MRRRLGLRWNHKRRIDAAKGWLALGVIASWLGPGGALAQGSAGVTLSVERCASAPFDVEAYVKALEVELQVLNAASLVPGSAPEGASGPQLIVALPGCDDELQVTLRVRDREEQERLVASDLAGVGQPRALALATIEVLRVLSLRVQAPQATEAPAAAETQAAAEVETETPAATAAEPSAEQPSAEDRAQPAAPAASSAARAEASSAADRPQRSGPPPWLLLHVRAGVGALGALDAHVHAGGALALWPSVWVKAELGYGQAVRRNALGALRAHQALAGALIELRARPVMPLELWAASGLRAGLTVVSAELELALAPGRRASDALAPLLYAPLELGALLDSGAGFVVAVFVEPGLWLAGARFEGASAAELGMPSSDTARPVLELLGVGLQAGLMLGYRF